MSKEMLINVSAGEECRIALLEDGKLEELYMERASSTSHVGNIYKGRVTNVEPSIQAAFVDFGLGRNGFLHISDLQPSYFGRKGEEVTEAVGRKISRKDRPPIQRCLRRGDDITVQIIKEGIGTKGPTLSTYLSIPGRILVMMPGMSKFGISKKIEDEDDRRRIRATLDSLKLPTDEVGFIVRTAGIGRNKTELDRDLKYLLRLWDNIQKKSEDNAPQELYTEGDLVTRTVRDVFTTDVEKIIVDNKDTAKRIKEFFKIAMPRTKNKVELYEDPMPLFHRYKIEPEIEKMYSRHVPLPSGGSLVIDQTEAVVAIDVNSGKFRDHSDAETTAFKTDMEAADEIPRQLRLRDLGGVIICDFIDLRFERHRRELEKKLHDNLREDRAKTKVLRMSQFGIIEMTRQRMRPSLKRSIYQDCMHCKGAGLVKTPESMSIDVMRRLAIAACNEKVARVELTVGNDVAFFLLNRKRQQLSELEEQCGKRIIIKADSNMAVDELKLELFDQRDGMVYLSELGVLPPSLQRHQSHPPRQGGRNDRRGRSDRGGRQPQEEDSIDREDLPDDTDAPRVDTKRVAVEALDEDEETPEKESNVVELDDAPEEMGEAPQGMDDDRDLRRRGGGRRGGGGGQNGRSGGGRDIRRSEPTGQRSSQASDRQTGDRQTGDRQTGDRQTGDRQTGDRQTGDRPTGDRQTGHRQGGDRQARNRQPSNRRGGDREAIEGEDSGRQNSDLQGGNRKGANQQSSDRPTSDRQRGDRQNRDEPRGAERRDRAQQGRREPLTQNDQKRPVRGPGVNRPAKFQGDHQGADEGLIADPEAPEPGNERVDAPVESEQDLAKKKRRRRGGRRHRARRERATARAAAEIALRENGTPIPPELLANEPDDLGDDEANDVTDAVDAPEVTPAVEETEDRRRSAPQRIPPQPREPQPPVVKTGTADKHLADDEPVDPISTPRRPRSRIDLDAIPDDFD